MWGSLQYVILNQYNVWRETDECYQWRCHNHNGDIPKNDKCWMGTDKWTAWQADGTPEDLSLCSSPRACRGTLRNCLGMKKYEYCMKVNDIYKIYNKLLT